MRVAFFTECYHPTVNGVVISVSTFARELRRLGAHVAIIGPRTPGYVDDEPHVYRLPARSHKSRPDYPIAMPRGRLVGPILEKERPQLIHTHSPFVMGAAAYLWARRLHVPLVFTFHTLYEKYVHHVPYVPRPLLRVFAKKYSRAFAGRARCVIAPSEGIRQMLIRDGVQTRIETVPTGIDLSLAENPQPVRHRWGIAPSARLLLYAGRLAPEKNLEMLLESMRTVAKREPLAHLLLAGHGPSEGTLRKLAERLGLGGRVHFVGRITRADVFNCAAEAEMFLFPSVTDTQGLVVVEAMASGAPCVAVNSAAVLGLVQHGLNGLLTTNDAGAFAQAVLSLLENEELRQRMSTAARRSAASLSAESTARRLLEIYEELVSASPVARRGALISSQG